LVIIFLQLSIPSFFEAKLALDDSEVVFNERAYTRFDVLSLIALLFLRGCFFNFFTLLGYSAIYQSKS
jgi:hypothetical protein